MSATAVSWLKPASSAEAVQMLSDRPSTTRAVAGCTSLTPAAIAADVRLEAVVDLLAAADIVGIELDDEALDVGATTSGAQLARHDMVAQVAPALAQAARTLGDEVIARSATLGGNLALRQRGTWELAAPVVAHDSVLVLRGPAGLEQVSADVLTSSDFHLAPDQLIIRVKLAQRDVSVYRRITTNLRSFPAAGVAATRSGDTYRVVAVFGVGRPQRLPHLEEALSSGSEALGAAVAQSVRDLPVTDSVVAGASYHAAAVRTLLEDLFLDKKADFRPR